MRCKREGSFLVQDGKPCNLQARLLLNKKGDSEIVRCLLFKVPVIGQKSYSTTLIASAREALAFREVL